MSTGLHHLGLDIDQQISCHTIVSDYYCYKRILSLLYLFLYVNLLSVSSGQMQHFVLKKYSVDNFSLGVFFCWRGGEGVQFGIPLHIFFLHCILYEHTTHI